MGTVMTHKAFGLYAEDSLAAACREVARIEGLLGRSLPDSEISRVNGSAGIKGEKVSLDTYDVLSKAVGFSRCFPGCFDHLDRPGPHPFPSGWRRAHSSRAGATHAMRCRPAPATRIRT